MKLLKKSAYNELISSIEKTRHELRMLEKRHRLSVEINQLQVDRISKLENENSELFKKAEKWDAELKRQALKSRIARIKKMSTKQLATRFLGISVKYHDDVPAIICGYSDTLVICACDHPKKYWEERVIDSSDVILQKYERYCYYSPNKVKTQIINSLK